MRTNRITTRPSLDDWLGRQLFWRSMNRRAVLGAFGSLPLLGCSSGSSTDGATGSTTGSTATADTESGSATTTDTSGSGSTGTDDLSCVLIPEETVGPFPLFNDISSASAYQREDITEGKLGTPLRLTLTILNANSSCVPITTAMVYVWHCDADGYYSGYNQQGLDARGQTFLRGVQTCDSNGQVSFLTIYPGWYTGRATHIHFRVYLGLDLQATSQLAFPDAVSDVVHVSSPYTKGVNSTRTLADGIFSDGVDYQLVSIAEDSSIGGYHAQLNVGIGA